MAMKISKATLGRLPVYLQYLRNQIGKEYISAAAIAKELSLGEVQVRKDLAASCGGGRPKVGYRTEKLKRSLEEILGTDKAVPVVIIGAGRLGQALLGYSGFAEYGLEILAAFDTDESKTRLFIGGKPVLPVSEFSRFCGENHVQIAALTVPAASAQEASDLAVGAGIRAVWNFAPYRISVPEGITVQQENLALSLAHLSVTASVSALESMDKSW